MNYQAVNMHNFFLNNYRLSPVAELEYRFEPVGDNDQDKRKSSMAFVKRMNTLEPALKELFDAQHHVLLSLAEMPVVYKLGFNKHAFNALAPLYAKLDKAVKEMQRLLKKHASVPEVVEYYKGVEPFLAVSVYDMMKADFSEFEKVTVARMAESQAKYPDWKTWDSALPEWETINVRYKDAKK